MAYTLQGTIGVDVTASPSTVAQFTLGQRELQSDGTVWAYLAIPTSTAIRQYDTVAVTPTSRVAALTNTNAATGVAEAIAQQAVASNTDNVQYMWFLLSNPLAATTYKVRAAAACAINARLASTAFGGTLDDTTAGSAVPVTGIVLTDSQPAGSSGSRTFRTAFQGLGFDRVV